MSIPIRDITQARTVIASAEASGEALSSMERCVLLGRHTRWTAKHIADIVAYVGDERVVVAR